MVEETGASSWNRWCYRISGGCNWRNHQHSGTDICSAVDPVSDLKAGEGFQKVRERKDSLIFENLIYAKIKDRWGSHRSFEGSINN